MENLFGKFRFIGLLLIAYRIPSPGRGWHGVAVTGVGNGYIFPFHPRPLGTPSPGGGIIKQTDKSKSGTVGRKIVVYFSEKMCYNNQSKVRVGSPDQLGAALRLGNNHIICRRFSGELAILGQKTGWRLLCFRAFILKGVISIGRKTENHSPGRS